MGRHRLLLVAVALSLAVPSPAGALTDSLDGDDGATEESLEGNTTDATNNTTDETTLDGNGTSLDDGNETETSLDDGNTTDDGNETETSLDDGNTTDDGNETGTSLDDGNTTLEETTGNTSAEADCGDEGCEAEADAGGASGNATVSEAGPHADATAGDAEAGTGDAAVPCPDVEGFDGACVEPGDGADATAPDAPASGEVSLACLVRPGAPECRAGASGEAGHDLLDEAWAAAMDARCRTGGSGPPCQGNATAEPPSTPDAVDTLKDVCILGTCIF